MSPQDERHGTTRGHAAGCRELCCRRARNEDEARRRKYREVYGITRSHDATGTRRRIHALMALGWPSKEIARRCGWTSGEAVLEVARRTWVQTPTAQVIARVYDELSMTPGPSPQTKSRARRNGWLPPLAWDDIDREKTPEVDPKDIKTHSDSIDHAVVWRVLQGDVLPTNTPERIEITRRWLASGRSERSLCARMGWKEGRYCSPRFPQSKADGGAVVAHLSHASQDEREAS